VVAFSNYAYPTKEGGDEGPVLFKVQGKPGVLKKNLALIPLLSLMLLFSGTDVLQSSVLILRTPTKFYGLSPDKAASVNTNSMTYATLISILVLLFGGVFYDLFGRRITISIMFAVGAVATLAIPSVAPSVPLYEVSRIIFNCSFVPIMMNPFINDYVRVQYRGLAMGL
jgi:MFS family permease